MGTHVGIGFSQKANPTQAAREAALEARRHIEHTDIDCAVVLSTIEFSSPDTIATIQETLGTTKIIGSSTAGIILSQSVETHGIAVLAIRSDMMQFGIGSAQDIEKHNIRQAGIVVAKNSIADFGENRRHAFIFFMDSLIHNTSPLLKGIQEVVGSGFPIIGAGSSDNFQFQKNYQYFQNKRFTSSAVGLLVGGQMQVSLGCHHGWKPLGKPRFITSAEDNIIHTIDNKKASLLYEEYFADAAETISQNRLGKAAILYPLGVYIPEENKYLIRNALDILKDGSIVCQGEVPDGAEVHIMIGNKDYCRQAAVDAALDVREGLHGKTPHVVIIFECLSRLKLLGRGAFKEIQMIREVLGYSTPIIGMYSYGEVSPFQSLDYAHKTYLHNESIIVLAIA